MIQEHEHISKTTQAVCIDTQPFPQTVTRVPSIEVGEHLYVGKNAFDYIFTLSKDSGGRVEVDGPVDVKSSGLVGMELGSSFAFLEGGSNAFRFNSNLSSCNVAESFQTRYGNAGEDQATEEKGDASNVMEKLKAQRDSEIQLPSRRV